MNRLTIICCLVVLAWIGIGSKRLAVPPVDFSRSLVLDGMDSPVSMQFLPDGRLLVAERAGVVHWSPPPYASLDADTFMTIPSVWKSGERGVQTIVHDPDFPTDPYLYVYYTHLGDGRNRVSRFTVSGDVADPSSEFIVWRDSLAANSIHQGGGLAFGNGDTLFITVGDAGLSTQAQDSTKFRGKILRKLKDGTVPANNPGVTDGLPQTPGDLFARGLRNPWRAWFDEATDRLIFGDVGPGASSWEEINIARLDADYGWPSCTGLTGCAPGVELPIYAYQRPAGFGAAVTGGFVYRGTDFPSAYRNSYYFGDASGRFIRRLSLDGAGQVIDMQFFDPADGSAGDADVGRVVDLEEGTDGALYWIDLLRGVLKTEYTGSNLLVDATVLLEGPYAGSGKMSDALSLPMTPPFTDPLYDGTPVELENAFYVDTPPTEAVDYVVVSLRSAVDIGSEMPGSRLPAFVDTTGRILNLDGTMPFRFPGVPAGNYYLVVAHRNHVAVMSDTMVSFSGVTVEHDFTAGSAYSMGGAAMIQLPDGKWAMFAGNALPDRDIQALDFNAYLVQTLAGAVGYQSADFNLDGAVQALDFDLYIANTTAGATSQVP